MNKTGMCALALSLTLASLAPAAEESKPRECGSTEAGPYLELTDIIQKFSKRTGKKFNIDPRVRAIPMFAGIDPDKLTYEQLLATFTVHGFASVVQDDVVIVVPDAVARQLPTPVYTDLNFKAAPDEWVTLILTPKKACSAHLVPILRPLMPQAAHMAAEPASGSLVLTDRASNLRRVGDLIEKLDKAAPGKLECGGGKSSN